MAAETTKGLIYGNLSLLYSQYTRLQEERDFLLNGVAARLTVVNAERQEVISEAQTQLDRLNALRAVDGEPALTLNDIQKALARRTRPGT